MWSHFFTLKIIFKSCLPAILIWTLYLCSCQPEKSPATFSEKTESSESRGESDIQHAVGFDLIDFQDYYVLHIINHFNDQADTLSYVLYKKEASIPGKFQGLPKIEIPIQKIALLHSSYVSYFDFCESENHIKAISEAKYIYNPSIYDAVQKGQIVEVGYGESLDKEKLLELGITAVVTVGFPNAPNKSKQVLAELGIPVLVFSDWQESTLLGRAEWVKVVAALTGSQALCKEKFVSIEQEYQRLQSLAAKVTDRPQVICNLPYKGSWYVPGGNSYMSNVFKDAGAYYPWSEDPGTGGIQIDFEVAYATGLQSDFWINPDFANNIKKLLKRMSGLETFSQWRMAMFSTAISV
jgi:iron complex transport system substrate-binding protein